MKINKLKSLVIIFVLIAAAGYANEHTFHSFGGGGLIDFNIYNEVGIAGQSIISDSVVIHESQNARFYIGFAAQIEIDKPDALVLTSPENGAETYSTQVLFQWNNTEDTWSGIQYYIFQFSRSNNFITLIADTQTTDTFIYANFQLAFDTFYWRIIAVDNFYNTSVSEIRIIKTYIPDNLPPVAQINIADTEIYVGQRLRLDGGGSYDIDGTINTYNWQYNGNNISTDSIAYLVIEETGAHNVILTVSDNYDSTASVAQNFNAVFPPITIMQTVSGVRPDNHYYTLAFEDLYPNVGDGDYNDFVADLNINRIINSSNQIQKIIITAKALARGAGYDHQFKIKLNFQGGASIERSLYDSLGRRIGWAKTTANNNANITLFDSTKSAFKNANKPNVYKNQAYIDGQSVTIEITLNSSQLNHISNADTPPYSPYLFVKNTNREIYLDSVDANGYPFALIVPSNWGWPLEDNQIDSDVKSPAVNVAYPLFRDWRLSGYNSKINWFDFPVENNIYPNSRPRRDNRQELAVDLRDKYAYSGDIITYKLEIKNNSGKEIHNLKIENILDDGLNFISNSEYPKADTTANNRLDWNTTNIAADSVIVYYYESKVSDDTYFIGKTLNAECSLYVMNKSTAQDSRTEITVIADYPLPPENFQALDYSGGNILLTFDKSPSPNIKEYKIYSDDGTGAINYNNPVVVITAGDTISYSFYKAGLQTTTDYLFGVRVTDNNLFEEKNTSRIVKINSQQIQSVETELRAYIKHPQPGQKITGNSVNVMAELFNNNDSIVFETTTDFADNFKNNFEFTNSGNPLDYVETNYVNNNLTVIVYTKEIEPDKISNNIFTVFKIGVTAQVSQLEYTGIKKGFYSYAKTINNFDMNNDLLKIYMTSAGKKNKTDEVKQILFQMKNVDDNVWFDIPAVKTNNSSGNPDFVAPYFVLSDFTVYSAGFYNLRAVVTDINNNVDANPPQITIEINHTDADSKKNIKDDGLTEVAEKVNPNKNNEVSMASITNNENDDIFIKLNLPLYSFDTSATIIMEVLNSDTAAIKEILDKNNKKKVSGLIEINFSDTTVKISDTNPLELSFAYIDKDNNNIIDNTTVNVFEMAIWTYSQSTGIWEKLVTKNVDTERKEIIAYAKHFSLFAIFSDKRAPAAINLSGVAVFPNPFKPNDGLEETGKEFWGANDVNNKTGIHIIGLTEDAVITIFDILGRRVKELRPISGSGMAIWDARYDDNRQAGSGVYMIVVKSGSGKVVRKVAIIR